MGMGVKGDLKAARVRMQAGEPAEALSIIQRILADSSPDLKDAQTLYTILVMQGMAGLAVDDLLNAESSFRRATETMPDAPQAWKGLIDCLERAGASRLDALPECLARAAEIAEGKGNWSRARTLRLRLGTVLDTLGRQEEALETVLRHLDNPEVLASGVDAGSTPAIERLSLLLLAAVLEVNKEEAAVLSRVEKRLAKDRGIGSTAGAASSAERHRASALTFEYRKKALGKDAAFEEDSVGTGLVGRRLSNALQALVREAEGTRSGEGDSSSISSSSSDAGGLMAQQHSGAWKALVARFCRVYLQRAVHIAEAAPTSSSSCKWRKVLAASAAVETAVGLSGWDEGWAATTKFVVSAYSTLIAPHGSTLQHQEGAGDYHPYTATAEELKMMATDCAEQDAGAGPEASPWPWLRAEASLHLAVLALWAGDASKADALLTTASAGGVTKLLSGPGSCWRELALRCLVDERLGGDGTGGGAGVGGGDASMTATAGLARVEAAIAAFDESFRLRGAPASEGSYADVLGSLGLARASLLLKLGRLEEARSSVETASAGALHATAADVDNGGLEAAAEEKVSHGQTCVDAADRPLCLHCRALCVASGLDLSEGQGESAKAKLQEVLDVDPGSADALSRLGRLLLGLDGGGEEKSVRRCGRRRRDDVEAARPLLERAVSEEPGCSSHAFWLARCYWEMGGQCREDRNFCFNSLLKAAKLDPSNAKAFEWLGYWYQGVGGDRERARGCFLRSVKLDPSLRGAGEALALLYLENGQETLAVGLFRQCAAVSVACHWAWAGLGRSKIVEGKLAEAASHIQQAIRGSPTSWSYWSDLGWCYHAEGKQAAALKAYTRAEELLEESLPEVAAPTEREEDDGSFSEEIEARRVELVARVRVRTQVGTIQRQIGQVDEAVASFSEALSLDPLSSLSLTGAGEAFLAQAHARTSEGLYSAAAKALRNGCEVIRRFLARRATDTNTNATGAAAASGDSSSGEGNGGGETGWAVGGDSAWKLLGDLHTYAHKLPPVCFEEEGDDGEGHVARGAVVWGPGTKEAVLEQAALAKEGARNRLAFVAKGADAYQELVQLLQTRVERLRNENEMEGNTEQETAAVALKAAAHYDLGLNYLLRARLVCADAGEGSGLFGQSAYDDLPAVADLSKLADQAFRSAIGSEAGYSDAWNGLGAVSRDPLTQQHCWVRAVQLEHNASAWANLGMLYVRWGLDIQAYESFGGLQAVTDHPTMWVGLGLLKEKEACQPGVTKAKRRRLLSQASDAYYSSLETGQHVDGLLGLGTTAGQTHSQADALVALQQHLDLSPHSSQAWNYLGAAAELAGRGTQAVAAYRRALGLLQEQSEKLKSAAATTEAAEIEAAILLTRGNLGRALVLTREAEEAASYLEDAGAPQVDNKLQLGRARALLGEWDAAVEALEQVSVGVDGLISCAAVRYLRGDDSGAIAAAGALMASHPDKRRVLHTVVSLAALAGDAGLAQQASRLLQGLPKRPTAADSDGRLSRQHVAEEDLWAIHLAMRATDAPDVKSRRALSKAVHLSPSSISSWARLGAAAADSAAAVATTSTKSGDDGGTEVSSKLAEDCLLAAEKLAMFSLLGRARDAGAASGGGAAGGGGDGDNGRVSAVAKDLATSLSGIAKATMCGGSDGGGRFEKSKNKGVGPSARVGEKGSSRTAVRQSCRAVHLYPGKTAAWRCLATALVGDSLSSVSEGRNARDAVLSDANILYRGISAIDSGRMGARSDAENGMHGAEAQYTQMLLGYMGAGQADVQSPGSSFVESLMAARAAVLHGADAADADGDAGREDAIERYKRALKIHPSSLVGWRELAVLYELCGRHHASAAALNCAAQISCSAPSNGASHSGGGSSGSKQRRGSARAAPLYLQMAAATLSMPPGQEDAGLAHVGNAFRVGKGGAAGHALRSLINARLGKESLAAGALARAREAGLHSTVAAAVAERLAAIQATPEEVSPAPPVTVGS
ncbi:unnamed protein product [Scytosiphon promiscuus]